MSLSFMQAFFLSFAMHAATVSTQPY